MIKEYAVNEELRSKFIKTQHKKHPKWKKRKIVRIILYIITVLMPTYVFLILYKDPNSSLFYDSNGVPSATDTAMSAFLLSFVVFAFFGTIALIYYKFLRRTCDCAVDFKVRESLFLTDSGLKNSYHPNDRQALRRSAYVLEVKYSDITELVLNKYHGSLTIYGTLNGTHYYDIEKNEVASNYIIDPKSGEGRRFYLYYNESEDFVNKLVERSNRQLKVIDESEE